MTYESRKKKISGFTVDDTITSASTFDFIKDGINKKTSWQNILDKFSEVYGLGARIFETEADLIASDIQIDEHAIVVSNNYGLYKITSLSPGGQDVTLTSGFIATLQNALDVPTPADYTELRAITTAGLVDGTPITVTNSGIAGECILRNVASHGLSDNGGTIIVINSNWYAERIFDGMVNVKWFGAKGDGVTDDTSSCQDAINAAALNANRDLFRYHGVFFPSPDVGYVITGLDCDSRVSLFGESKWNTRIILAGLGHYFCEKPKTVENFWLDGVAIQNGANRIDQVAWVRAERANTGVIIGNANGLGQMNGSRIRSCRFTNLGVAVHRDSSFNTSVEDCHIGECWHGIFMRADLAGSNQEINMCTDWNNYIGNLNGIGIGWSSQGLLGAKQYSFSGTTIEVCCKDAAHDGINGYWDSGGSNVKTPYAETVYFEGNTGTYPNAIGIRATVMELHGFYFQSLGTPIKAPSTGSFWTFVGGEFVSTGGTYDIDMTGHTSGRNTFDQIAFSKGINPSAMAFVTLKNSSSSGVLVDGNSNEFRDDSTLEINKQSGVPLTINRRASDGNVLEIKRQGTVRNAIYATTTYTAFTSPIRHPVYTVATLPSASAYQYSWVGVSNASSGPVMCFSNGTNWIDVLTGVTVVT
jgi:hypothetical protein